MKIAVTALEERLGGDEAVVTVVISNGEHSEERKLSVASNMLFEIGRIGLGSLPYELSLEQFDSLEYSSRLWGAVKKALDLLSYSDCSKRRLTEKLIQRGFSREISEEASDYAERLGYIDEREQLSRAVNSLAEKGYGRSRIKQELVKKGISREVISDELEDLLDGIDFDESLAELLERKVDFSRLDSTPAGLKYRESVISAMFRYGYPPSDVKRKLREMM